MTGEGLGGEDLAGAFAAAEEGAQAAGRQERARRELAAMMSRYAEPGRATPIELDLRTTGDDDDRGPGRRQAHLICSGCRQSVLCLAKDLTEGVSIVSAGIIEAAAIRHYREAHTDGGGNPV